MPLAKVGSGGCHVAQRLGLQRWEWIGLARMAESRSMLNNVWTNMDSEA
jgi:hypothetical protein